jgi:hypothetical protein
MIVHLIDSFFGVPVRIAMKKTTSLFLMRNRVYCKMAESSPFFDSG